MASNDQLFYTLTSDDWKRGLANARLVGNDVAAQIRDVCLKLSSDRNNQSMPHHDVEREQDGGKHNCG